MQSHVHVSMHMQNPQHKQKIAQNSQSTVQSYMLNRNFVVATATLVTVAYCFRNYAIFYFMLSKTFEMLQSTY